MPQKKEKERKKREKERETRFNWPESPFKTERKIPFFLEEKSFFFSFLSSVFFFLPELFDERTLLLLEREFSIIERPQKKKSPLSLSHNRRENTLNTRRTTTTEERERETHHMNNNNDDRKEEEQKEGKAPFDEDYEHLLLRREQRGDGAASSSDEDEKQKRNDDGDISSDEERSSEDDDDDEDTEEDDNVNDALRRKKKVSKVRRRKDKENNVSLTSTPTPRRRGAEDTTTTTTNNNSNNEKKIISNNTNENDLEEEEQDEGDDPYELTKFVVCGNLFEVKKKYVPIKPIGKGGVCGIVCSAKDEKQNTKVAIKKITNAFENVVDAKRTLREIKLLRHLRHENVVPITDCMLPSKEEEYNFNDVHVMYELMDTDLHQIIRSDQPLTDDHCQYFIYQLLRGLKYIHSADVLHRDLKPSNLLLNANCDLKICDFGLARTNTQDKNRDFMTEYVVTRWYRAPELLLSCAEYTVAIDVWSCGCILAELLGRKPLFPGKITSIS